MIVGMHCGTVKQKRLRNFFRAGIYAPFMQGRLGWFSGLGLIRNCVMDWLGGGILNLAEKRLRYLDRRQEVLAHNVANADTPKWRARDLRPFADVLADGTGAAPVRTRSDHLQGTRDPLIRSSALVAVAARAPNGNSVALEEQLMQVAQVESDQKTAVNIFHKYLALFRLALGRAQ